MGRKLLKNFVALVVALVVTAGAVTLLSAATKTSPDAAEQYSQAVRQTETNVAEFSAPAPTHEAGSLLEGLGGFVLILVVSAGGGMFLLRAMQKGRLHHRKQSYQPRRDMTHTAPRKARVR